MFGQIKWMKKQNAKTQGRKDAKIDTEQQAWAQRFALAHPWASRGRKRWRLLLRRIALSPAARPRMRPKAAHAREPKGISLRPCVFAFCCSASAKQLRTPKTTGKAFAPIFFGRDRRMTTRAGIDQRGSIGALDGLSRKMPGSAQRRVVQARKKTPKHRSNPCSSASFRVPRCPAS